MMMDEFEDAVEINTAELFAIYKEITAHPEGWYQGDWAVKRLPEPNDVCDTAYCFAGHAVIRAGDRIVWADETAGSSKSAVSMRNANGGLVKTLGCRARCVLRLMMERTGILLWCEED